jgi:hypothetical protein
MRLGIYCMIFGIVILHGVEFYRCHVQVPSLCQNTPSIESSPAVPEVPRYTTPAGFVRTSERPIEVNVKTALELCKQMEGEWKKFWPHKMGLNHTGLGPTAQGLEAYRNSCVALEKAIGDLKRGASNSWWKTSVSFMERVLLSWSNAFAFMGVVMFNGGVWLCLRGFSGLSWRDMTTVVGFVIVGFGAFFAVAPSSAMAVMWLKVVTLWISLHFLVDERVNEVREV